MVQNLLDDMRRNPQARHAGRGGAPKIMDPPIIRLYGCLYAILGPPETRDGGLSRGREHIIGAQEPRDAVDNLENRFGKRDLVGDAVLGAGGRDGPCPLGKIKLRPAHAADLAPALSRKEQEHVNAAKGIALTFGRLQKCRYLLVGQDALARNCLSSRRQARDWVDLDHPLVQRPIHQFLDGGEGVIGTSRNALGHHVIKQAHNVGPRNRSETFSKEGAKLLVQDALALAPVAVLGLGVALDELRDHLTECYVVLRLCNGAMARIRHDLAGGFACIG